MTQFQRLDRSPNEVHLETRGRKRKLTKHATKRLNIAQEDLIKKARRLGRARRAPTERLTDRSDRPSDRPTNRPTDRPPDRIPLGRPTPPTDRPTDRLTDRTADGPTRRADPSAPTRGARRPGRADGPSWPAGRLASRLGGQCSSSIPVPYQFHTSSKPVPNPVPNRLNMVFSKFRWRCVRKTEVSEY